MTPAIRRLAAASLGLALLAACGGSDGPTAPRTPDISGTWRVSFSNLTGSGITCGSSAIDYVISQSGSTFTGTSSSTYTLTCTDGINTLSQTFTGATISNGHINGSAIDFDLATSAAHQTGTLSGNSMSGSATWSIDLGNSGTVVLRGQFGGVKL
jgi:hypothetical protein